MSQLEIGMKLLSEFKVTSHLEQILKKSMTLIYFNMPLLCKYLHQTLVPQHFRKNFHNIYKLLYKHAL